MDRVQIPHLDSPLSRLVMGSAWFHEEQRDRIEALLDAWVEVGGTTIDTAENYSGGQSEVMIGRWLRDSGMADRVVVITKGGHPYDGRNRITPADIETDLLGSLDRLGLDRIDPYLLHRDDPSVPVGEIVDLLDGHRAAGRIVAFGGSDWSTERLAEASAWADANRVQRFSASSPNLSLAVWTEPPWEACVAASDAASRDWYARTRMPLIAWSSQASGWFPGPGRSSDPVAMAGRRNYDTPDNRERMPGRSSLAASAESAPHRSPWRGSSSSRSPSSPWSAHGPWTSCRATWPRSRFGSPPRSGRGSTSNRRSCRLEPRRRGTAGRVLR